MRELLKTHTQAETAALLDMKPSHVAYWRKRNFEPRNGGEELRKEIVALRSPPEGMSVRQIAKRLGISVGSVRYQLRLDAEEWAASDE